MPLGAILERDDGNGNVYTVYTCSSCDTEHDFEVYAADCCMYDCEYCGEIWDSPEAARECCPYECEHCGARYSSEEESLDCCYEAREEEEFRRNYLNPEYPAEILEVEPSHIIYIPRRDDRPTRICSIEQELSSGGAAVARMLYESEMSEYDNLLNYTAEGRPRSIIVKNDGSLQPGGGEVVYGRFNLSDMQDARHVSTSLARIEAMRQAGIVRAEMDAGTHIHISAQDVNGVPIGPAQMAAIYEIFSFGEDVIFRIGAAGTPAHRGTRYTQIIPKFTRDQDPITPSKVAKGSMRQRYFSLNFQRLLNAVHNCRCGAGVVGDWAACECDVLRAGTVEWRVFNSTTDPETLHAWLLLAQGITAASFTHQLHTLTPNAYEQTDVMLHPWIFGWLLWNCPFEDEERQILFNTARQAPGLALPWENIDQFHEGWGQLELPMPPTPDPDEGLEAPEPDGSFPGCECASCTAARAHFAQFDPNPRYSRTGVDTAWTEMIIRDVPTFNITINPLTMETTFEETFEEE